MANLAFFKYLRFLTSKSRGVARQGNLRVLVSGVHGLQLAAPAFRRMHGRDVDCSRPARLHQVKAPAGQLRDDVGRREVGVPARVSSASLLRFDRVELERELRGLDLGDRFSVLPARGCHDGKDAAEAFGPCRRILRGSLAKQRVRTHKGEHNDESEHRQVPPDRHTALLLA